jgi:general secretion pathway protein A
MQGASLTMYEKYYCLKEAPFNLTPDPSFLFLNKRCKEALNLIWYSIERREGFALIIGDIGTGKTTLSRSLLERLSHKQNVRTAMIQNPMLSEDDIYRTILQDLGAGPSNSDFFSMFDENERANTNANTNWMSGMNKKQLLDSIYQFLLERAHEDVFTVLIIDEAQKIPTPLVEQLRLISNLETAKKKLLQIIFVGTLEINEKLKTSMRQLDQRISVRFEAKALSLEDTEAYIRHRLNIAGASCNLSFSKDAYKAVWKFSKGYPRLINLVCDRALMVGCMQQAAIINKSIVRAAAHILQGGEKKEPLLPFGWLRKLAFSFRFSRR